MSTKAAKAPRLQRSELQKNRGERLFFHAMLFLPVLFLFIYHFLPMPAGILMAFENFQPAKGFFGSKFVGFKNFQRLFALPDTWPALVNTLIIAIEKIGFKKNFLDKHKAAGHVYVLFTVMLGFVLFNASSLSEVVTDIAGLFSFASLPLTSPEAVYYLQSYAVIFVLAIVGATPLPKNIAF